MLTASFNNDMNMTLRDYWHSWDSIPVQVIGRQLDGDTDVDTQQKCTIRVTSGVSAL